MPIESLQGSLKLHWQAERIEVSLRLAASSLGHVATDGLPENAVFGHVPTWDVVCHRHSRQLDDTALYGVHKREVANCPREQRTLGIARSSQEKGCG